MASTKKIITTVVVVTVIGIGVAIIIYVFRCSFFKNLESCVQDPNKKTPIPPTPPGASSTKWLPEAPPYNVGMWGTKIKALQVALGFPAGDCDNCADGKLSTNTKNAIIAKGYAVPLTEADYNKIMGITSNTGGGTPPVDPGNVVGKKVYAKAITNIRSTPDVNDGWINNKVCQLPANYEPAPVILEMKDCSKAGTGCVQLNPYFWYKISFEIANCTAKTGWVRQDVVTVQ